MNPFLGMRSVSDFASNELPESWRQGILYLYPNGKTSLTALTNLMGSEKADNPKFQWNEKGLPTQAGAVTALYTDAILSAAYSTGATIGTILYVKCAEAIAKEFLKGYLVMLRDESASNIDAVGKVLLAPYLNGASSYVAVKLLYAGAGGSLTGVDRILAIGSVNPEGGERPSSIIYDPTDYYNYTQIFRTSLDLTRTAKETHLRTAEARARAKKEALELHGIQLEKAFLYSYSSLGTGDNGKAERTTMGLINWIIANAADNIFDYRTDVRYTGKTWLEGGDDFLDTCLEQTYRYGSDKMCFGGSGAILGVNKLAKAKGTIQITPNTTEFGMKVATWVTPFGDAAIKTHPLMSYEPTDRNMLLLFEPKDLKYRFITDTIFKEDKTERTGGGAGTDGTQEEFLTECGLEFHHAAKCAIIRGVGQDNTL